MQNNKKPTPYSELETQVQEVNKILDKKIKCIFPVQNMGIAKMKVVIT